MNALYQDLMGNIVCFHKKDVACIYTEINDVIYYIAYDNFYMAHDQRRLSLIDYVNYNYLMNSRQPLAKWGKELIDPPRSGQSVNLIPKAALSSRSKEELREKLGAKEIIWL